MKLSNSDLTADLPPSPLSPFECFRLFVESKKKKKITAIAKERIYIDIYYAYIRCRT